MKNFFDSKNEKITDKAFLHTAAVSVVSILLCLVLLCSVTYAWFSTEDKSESNKLVSGSFGVTISVAKVVDGVVTSDKIDVKPVDGREGLYDAQLAVGTYLITLEMADSATVKGHCVVTLGDKETLRTAAIIGENTSNRGDRDVTAPFTFKITLTEAMTVTFEPRWGEAAHPDIAYRGEYSESDFASTESESTQQTTASTTDGE